MEIKLVVSLWMKLRMIYYLATTAIRATQHMLHQIHRSPYCHVKVVCWFDPCVQ